MSETEGEKRGREQNEKKKRERLWEKRGRDGGSRMREERERKTERREKRGR